MSTVSERQGVSRRVNRLNLPNTRIRMGSAVGPLSIMSEEHKSVKSIRPNAHNTCGGAIRSNFG